MYFAAKVPSGEIPVYYFGAAYGAGGGSVGCVAGQAMTAVELYGPFATSAAGVKAHTTTLDTHDWAGLKEGGQVC